MKQEKKSWRWAFWSLLGAAEAVGALLIARWQGLSAANTAAMNARWLSDGCFVVGMVMTGVGLLTWVATTGFFDMLSYGIQYGVRAVIGLFGGNRKPNNQDFYDYKMAKEGKRGRPVLAALCSGIAWIAVAALLLIVYYNG